ncbi:ribosomal protein S17 [Candidatus Dojkabacteria bacterium]|jgi:small subunit ribosomal protein S17|nr:ribosomal protein S17 [Candidatus Dojkabacteria bacterium]
METKEKSNKRILEGVVSGNKMEKTLKVEVEYSVAHPRYKKVMRRKKTFFAHCDEKLEVGTKVKIIENKPISKNVKWLVIKNNGTD